MRDVGVVHIIVDVPAGRERALARYGVVAKAQALRRMNAKRRDATMLAVLSQLKLDTVDDALVLLIRFVDQPLFQAACEHKDERFKALPKVPIMPLEFMATRSRLTGSLGLRVLIGVR